MATTPSERRPPPTKEDVANLPGNHSVLGAGAYFPLLVDFSEELKALGMYRDDYMNWRKGGHKGAKGEVHDVSCSGLHTLSAYCEDLRFSLMCRACSWRELFWTRLTIPLRSTLLA